MSAPCPSLSAVLNGVLRVGRAPTVPSVSRIEKLSAREGTGFGVSFGSGVLSTPLTRVHCPYERSCRRPRGVHDPRGLRARPRLDPPPTTRETVGVRTRAHRVECAPYRGNTPFRHSSPEECLCRRLSHPSGPSLDLTCPDVHIVLALCPVISTHLFYVVPDMTKI